MAPNVTTRAGLGRRLRVFFRRLMTIIFRPELRRFRRFGFIVVEPYPAIARFPGGLRRRFITVLPYPVITLPLRFRWRFRLSAAFCALVPKWRICLGDIFRRLLAFRLLTVRFLRGLARRLTWILVATFKSVLSSFVSPQSKRGYPTWGISPFRQAAPSRRLALWLRHQTRSLAGGRVEFKMSLGRGLRWQPRHHFS